MDNFDDLLSARHSLEDNPFQSPFANARSNSPDPWASYGFQEENTFEGIKDNTTSSPFQANADTYTADAEQALQSTDFDLESSGQQQQPRSPGFRESVSPPESPILFNGKEVNEDDALSSDVNTLQNTGQKPSSSPPRSGSLTPQSPSTPKLAPAEARLPSTPHTPNSSDPTKQAQVVSPLDNTTAASLGSSFASLVLGGESIGGWQDSDSASSAFVNDHTNPSTTNASPIATSSRETGEKILVHNVSNTSQRNGYIEPLFSITVDDPQKVGDPIRPYILYTVHTKTSSPLYSKSSFSVLRRYSDFLWLWEILSLNNPGVFVPPVPEKSPFNRFDNQFIQQRRLALQKCVQKIADHPVLSNDPDLKLFLESDTFALDIKHRKAEMAQERGGLISTLGQTITGPRFYEIDEWFDTRKAYLDGLEIQLKAMVKAIEVVSKQRAELAVASSEFAASVEDLAASDMNGQLSQSLSILSEVEKKSSELEREQEQEDILTFMSTADEYARIINSIRYAFTSRIRLHANWQNTETEVRRVKLNHEKSRNQGRPMTERLGYSLSQVAEAERKALDAKQEFEQCSRLIKSEMARFETERVRNFKESLEAFLGGMISRQKEQIIAWEKYQQHLLQRGSSVSTTQGNSNGFT